MALKFSIFHLLQYVSCMKEYGGAQVRQSDIFGTQDAVVKITKRFFKVSYTDFARVSTNIGCTICNKFLFSSQNYFSPSVLKVHKIVFKK